MSVQSFNFQEFSESYMLWQEFAKCEYESLIVKITKAVQNSNDKLSQICRNWSRGRMHIAFSLTDCRDPQNL